MAHAHLDMLSFRSEWDYPIFMPKVQVFLDARKDSALGEPDDSGIPRGAVDIRFDATERMPAEEALRESEQRFALFMRHLPGLAWIKDSQGRYVYANNAAEIAFRTPRAQFYGKTDDELFPPVTAAQFKANDRHALANGTGVQTVETLIHEDGILHHSIVSKFPLPGPGGAGRLVGGIAVDITELKQAEEALQRRVDELTVLNRIGAICSDARTEDEVLQGATAEIAGTWFPDNCGFLLLDATRGVLVTHSSFVLSDPTVSRADKCLGMGITGQVALTGQTRRAGDVSREPGYLAADSRTRSELCVPMKIGSSVVGVFNVESQDLNAFSAADEQLLTTVVDLVGNAVKRLRAERALRESEERYRLIADLASSFSYQAMITVDHQVIYQWVGGKFFEVTGYQPEELGGRGWFALIPPEDLPALLQQVAGLRSPETDRSNAVEVQITTRTGETRWIRSVVHVASASPQDEPMTIYGAGLDITERKRAEEARRNLEAQIQHAQKLESLGVLAGGIAHDFNNLLTSMLGYASLAMTHLPHESPACPMLSEIEQAAVRAADLTQQMLAYSGKGKFVIESVRLDTLVREMNKLLQPVVSKSATVDLDLKPATIEGDITQIRQVVMNLMINGSDALEGNTGLIRVRTGVRNADTEFLRSPFIPDQRPAGRYAFVEVEDNGCGMNEDILSRIFDPFFTTKFTGRGLGLAAVLGIVRGHHGMIKVASEPGRGTTFQVLIPCATSGATAGVDSGHEGPLPQGHGMVLLVEDEPAVRAFTRSVLENSGFHVLTAEDGSRGLEVFVRHRQKIDAVILDLNMARMDGLEALRHVRSLAPGLPIVVMSGLGEQQVVTRSLDLGANAFIPKPFVPRDLITRLCQLLS